MRRGIPHNQMYFCFKYIFHTVQTYHVDSDKYFRKGGEISFLQCQL